MFLPKAVDFILCYPFLDFEEKSLSIFFIIDFLLLTIGVKDHVI